MKEESKEGREQGIARFVGAWVGNEHVVLCIMCEVYCFLAPLSSFLTCCLCCIACI
jgi:hypothetical protein